MLGRQICVDCTQPSAAAGSCLLIILIKIVDNTDKGRVKVLLYSMQRL